MRIPEHARTVLESDALGHLVTINPDGSPQVSVIWVGLDGDEIIAAHVPNNQKVKNIRRDGRVVLSVETDRMNEMGLTEYLVIKGTARITPTSSPATSCRRGTSPTSPSTGSAASDRGRADRDPVGGEAEGVLTSAGVHTLNQRDPAVRAVQPADEPSRRPPVTELDLHVCGQAESEDGPWIEDRCLRPAIHGSRQCRSRHRHHLSRSGSPAPHRDLALRAVPEYAANVSIAPLGRHSTDPV
jgi:PPOX class probable F420-dependent enzyme